MGLLSFGRKHCCEDNGDLCEKKSFLNAYRLFCTLARALYSKTGCYLFQPSLQPLLSPAPRQSSPPLKLTL